MKKNLIPVLFALALLIPVAPFLTSCGTNAPTKAAQAEAVLITSVNAGMSQWASYVNAGKAKQSQIDTVKTAYNSYYAAQLIAKAVIEKAIAKDPTATAEALNLSSQAVTDAENNLITLLNALLKK